jgi:hypothetical protein
MLAAQATVLIARESQVESLTTDLCEGHDATTAHSAEVLRLQSALDTQADSQADISRQEAEEA